MEKAFLEHFPPIQKVKKSELELKRELCKLRLMSGYDLFPDARMDFQTLRASCLTDHHQSSTRIKKH